MSEITTQPDAPASQTRLKQTRWQQAGAGLLPGLVIGMCFALLGVYNLLYRDELFLVTGLIGAALGLTRARRLLLAGAGLNLLLVGIVAYTPLASMLIARWNRTDILPPGLAAPAVVVLSSHVQKGQTFDSRALERTMRGYELLEQGRAQRLVVTEATLDYGSQAPLVRAQMHTFHLDFPLDTVGPVRNTHDEALATARLARERGWTRVLLVTHPGHMRRAAAVFEKAGVHVLCAPCNEGGYDVEALNGPWSRLAAFRDWLYEVVGYRIYRLRGWI